MVFVLFTDPPLAYIGMTEDEARTIYAGDPAYTGSPVPRRGGDGGLDRGRLGKVQLGWKTQTRRSSHPGRGPSRSDSRGSVPEDPCSGLANTQRNDPCLSHLCTCPCRAGRLAFSDHTEESFRVRMWTRLFPGLKNRRAFARQRAAEQEEISGGYPKQEIHPRPTGPSGEEVT